MAFSVISVPSVAGVGLVSVQTTRLDGSFRLVPYQPGHPLRVEKPAQL